MVAVLLPLTSYSPSVNMLTSLLLLSPAVLALDNVLDVPASAFTSWQFPTAESGPCDVSLGPDGLLYAQEFFANKIVRFNQHTGEFLETDIPFTVPILDQVSNVTLPIPGYAKFELLSCAIRTGYDGHMYFSNGAHNQLVRYNVTNQEVQVFTPPGLLSSLGNLQPFNDVTSAPDGIYFTQTTANVITHFDYETHKFTEYPLPTLLSDPLGIFFAKDGGIWFLEFTANKVGRFDRQTKEIKEHDLPFSASQPLVMRGETPNDDGSTTLWFACTTSSSIAGINTRTRVIQNFPEPNAPTLPIEVGQDQHDNIWSTHLAQNSLGVLNPRTGNVSVVVEPDVILGLPALTVPFYGETCVFGRAVGQPPGRGDADALGNAMWYTHFLTNQLVRLDLTNVTAP